METKLINVEVKNNQQLVSARDLHKALELKRHFGDWVKQNFKDFEEGTDFVFAPQSARHAERRCQAGSRLCRNN